MRKLLTVILAALVLSCGCKPSDPDGDFTAVNAEGWAYGDTLGFVLQTADSIWSGDIAVAVRHTAAYPYSNVWLEVSYPAGDSVIADTLNIILADEFGNWRGRGLGLSFLQLDTVIHGLTVNTPAPINLRHIMRTDLLTDIEQIGLIYIPASTDHSDE